MSEPGFMGLKDEQDWELLDYYPASMHSRQLKYFFNSAPLTTLYAPGMTILRVG